MVRDLESEFGGERAAAEVLGPSIITVRAWKRRRTMSVPSRRLVWLIWALTLHPEQVQSVDGLLTWGRFRTERRWVARPNEEWTDWEI